MGRPKALLPHPASGLTFVRHLIQVFRTGGVDQILVVGRPADEDLRLETLSAGAILVTNSDPARGQLSSLIVGIDHAQSLRARGALVTPVDLPGLSASVVAELTRAASGSAAVIRPTFGGRGGHPVYFDARVFGELRAADPTEGARAVVRAYPARVVEVEVDEAGVITDVDTLEDYQRLLRR